MTHALTDRQRAVLVALCDTFVPAVRPPAVEAHDPTGFWARTASDVGAHDAVADDLLTVVGEQDREGLLQLLDLLGATGFPKLPQTVREGVVKGMRKVSDDIADGIDAFLALTMLETYGRMWGGEPNPNWGQSGYPGPPDVAADHDRLSTWRPSSEDRRVELDADVVVVGSGSGGGVIAGELATRGQDVVVLEAGPHKEDDDFPRDELTALRQMYWRGGAATDDGNVTLLAGATLGGGSTVNWTNCVPPPDHVREQWARIHGLTGLDAGDFDDHLDAVLDRISATDQASELNVTNDLLRQGAEALGWSWHRSRRNTDVERYDPATAGHMGFGDRSGSKQGTLKTYLRDAVGAGARVVPSCRVQRVLVEAGRAAGVVGTYIGSDGRAIPVTVRARHVVVAGGALETPALLLRSGIGGPAVGRYLRVHPVPNLSGVYDLATEGWWGAPQTVIVDEHTRIEQDHGFLIETPHLHPGLSAAAVPWRGGRDHKLITGRSSNFATFIAVTREHGAGQVTIDEQGEAVVSYPLVDPLDLRLLRQGIATMVRLHVAAGARNIIDLHPKRLVWHRGDDVEGYIDALTALPFGKRERGLFSAHQMGTARMGTDPATSVADPDGRLHDTPGVWIGDTSAFPTAVGSNPMVTCMALARRTAHALLDAT